MMLPWQQFCNQTSCSNYKLLSHSWHLQWKHTFTCYVATQRMVHKDVSTTLLKENILISHYIRSWVFVKFLIHVGRCFNSPCQLNMKSCMIWCLAEELAVSWSLWWISDKTKEGSKLWTGIASDYPLKYHSAHVYSNTYLCNCTSTLYIAWLQH